jgi:ABC transporter substrate binding protein
MAARACTMPVVGFLRSTSLATSTDLVAAFRQGLTEAGFVESQNVAIEYHSAEGQNDWLPSLVAEMIRRPVAVIIGNSAAASAAKAATTTVPIVFAYGGDPVRDGLVASLNRPGGNVTGVNFFGGDLGAKRQRPDWAMTFATAPAPWRCSPRSASSSSLERSFAADRRPVYFPNASTN